MSRYFCPFCSSRYQFHITRNDGVLICGQCGDPLMKKPLINGSKFFALFATTAFLAPLLIMIVFVINDLTEEKLNNNSEKLVLLVFK
tara:strand:- start:170 stop:430 length:261 start_codon:yes stop_codon:yes gene_type:complete